jgi:glycosyltransferase involved in cell wall biosynthesis
MMLGVPAPIRILAVITDPDRRGAQVFAHDLGAELAARGHTVTTVALGPGRGSGAVLDAEVLGGGVRDPRALLALRRRMAAVDVTIAHGASTGPACALAGGGHTRPFVYRQISDSRFWAPTWVRRWRVRAALSRARLVVALSEFNRRELVEWIGVPERRIRVVPNGVPPEPFVPADAATRAAARTALGLPDRLTVAFVGALVPEKGADVMVEHVAALGDDVQVVIAGDGPEREHLERLATRAAPNRVRFLGSVADVVPVYHAADAVAFPSRGGDAMPATLLEAGLCGLPVVATAIGAIPEVVLDGETGVVAGPEPDARFVEEVAALLRDPGRRTALGAAARARCLERYAIGPVTDAWEQVLAEAVSGRGR